MKTFLTFLQSCLLSLFFWKTFLSSNNKTNYSGICGPLKRFMLFFLANALIAMVLYRMLLTIYIFFHFSLLYVYQMRPFQVVF